MFTGIIEEVGTVAAMQRGARTCVLTIKARVVLADAHVGDSIAVNGVCLTVTSFSADRFSADVMNETLERSSLGHLRPGARVNLERAMQANGRFGGHIVSGHIDGTGTITTLKDDGNAVWYTIAAPRHIAALIVEKGSVAIDGISLTVARAGERDFAVSVIPHTRAATNLALKGSGDVVNLENDVIAKYVERLMATGGALAAASAVCVQPADARGVPSGNAGPQSAGAPSAGVPSANASRPDDCAGQAGITYEFLLENGF